MKTCLIIILSALFCSKLALASVDSRQCDNRYAAKELTSSSVSDADKQSLALSLLSCLRSPDPAIRDTMAFTVLSTWMREGELETSTLMAIKHRLITDIREKRTVEEGVYLPFALLALSEVVRVDRITPYLEVDDIQQVVDVTGQYLSTLTDYRGFDPEFGWRHNAAHGADVFLQLALNDRTSAEQHRAMSETLSALINPGDKYFYHYAEPQRLARAAAYLMLRDSLPVKYWNTWLAEIANPAPYASWRDVFTDDKGLAKRHNTRQFLLELFAMISDTDNTRLKAISNALKTHLKNTA